MELNKIPVSELMTTNIVSVSPQEKLIEVKHIFEKKDFHHHIPVTEKGKLVGIISLVDFLYAIKNATLDDNDKTYHSLKVADIMRTHLITAGKETSVAQIAEMLIDASIHSILITSGNALVGIVTTTDLIRFFLKEYTGEKSA